MWQTIMGTISHLPVNQSVKCWSNNVIVIIIIIIIIIIIVIIIIIIIIIYCVD